MFDEDSGQTEITKKKFASVNQACKRKFRPSPGFTERTFDSSGFSEEGNLNFCICGTQPQENKSDRWRKEKKFATGHTKLPRSNTRQGPLHPRHGERCFRCLTVFLWAYNSAESGLSPFAMEQSVAADAAPQNWDRYSSFVSPQGQTGA